MARSPGCIAARSRVARCTWVTTATIARQVGHPHLHWTLDPGPLAAMAIGAFVYVRRFRSARREAGGRGAGPLQAAAFAAAMLALVAALVSPIDGLGEDYLF